MQRKTDHIITEFDKWQNMSAYVFHKMSVCFDVDKKYNENEEATWTEIGAHFQLFALVGTQKGFIQTHKHTGI